MYEQELKLTAPGPGVLDDIVRSQAVLRHAMDSPKGPMDFLARYYDGPNGEFASRKWALRARREGEIFRAALKMRGDIVDGLSSREEYECDIPTWFGCLHDLPYSELRDNALEVMEGDMPLVEVVVVDMKRTIVDLDIDGTHAELVTDAGSIASGGRSVELYELELELKSGEMQGLLDLGQRIRTEHGLWPSEKTKYEIGLELGSNS